ncbi:hypothetical protein LCGC14_0316940 [marine sediment metagenome]|uniref:Uncharacterized protein n=1 Tax=marine sediment metagenome TaxID=412755 RepID=A0A0F9U3A5_9ZZZZ
MVYQGRRAGPGAFNNSPANTACPGSGGQSLTEFLYPMGKSIRRRRHLICDHAHVSCKVERCLHQTDHDWVVLKGIQNCSNPQCWGVKVKCTEDK